MLKRIRKEVFETNSSSVHSLTFAKDGRELSEFKLNKDGKIDIDFGSFGRELRYYSTQYHKLSYLITCLYYLSGFDYDDIYNNYEFQQIEEAVCEYTGAKGIHIIGEVEPELDHQSQPEYEIEIIDSYDKEQIIDFIFNKYVILKTDSD